jgi:IS4 transposase
VAQQRRRRIREGARQRGETPSQESLALADWTVVITNAPVELMSAQEAFILLHIRWQIELLFKLWKSHAKIDEWRSENPHRILCERIGSANPSF